jgi:hypothetical protein
MPLKTDKVIRYAGTSAHNLQAYRSFAERLGVLKFYQKKQAGNKYCVEMNAVICNAFVIVGTKKHEPRTCL